MITLTNLMFQGPRYPNYNTMNNFTLKLLESTLLARDKGIDIVGADESLKQQRLHRGYSG